MSASTVSMIRKECEKYASYMNIPPESIKDLEKLAIQSYYNMPAKKRGSWSLKQIVEQGL